MDKRSIQNLLLKSTLESMVVPDLSNKIVAVTGSSSGIGRETAILAAKSGASLILHYNQNRDGIETTATEVTTHGVECMIIQADFHNRSGQNSFCEEAWSWKNRIDVLVNNAGGDVLTNERKHWTIDQKLEFLWNVDVLSCIYISRDIGARMKSYHAYDSAPAIINIGWDQAISGQAGDSGEIFSVTKGAIMCFSKSLAKSLAPNVRVNCVAPGWIQTSWGASTSQYWDNRAKGESLLNRWGNPNDIASAICFLASDESEFINGQTSNPHSSQSIRTLCNGNRSNSMADSVSELNNITFG